MTARVFPVSFYQFLSVFMLSGVNAENSAALKTKKTPQEIPMTFLYLLRFLNCLRFLSYLFGHLNPLSLIH